MNTYHQLWSLGGYRLVLITLSLFSAISKVRGQLPDTLLHQLSHPFGNSPNFGNSVAVSGSRVVVAGWSGSASNYAYVYELTNSMPNLPALSLTYPNEEAGNSFGNSVAIVGTRVVVGSPGSGQTSKLAGKIFLYDLAGPVPNMPDLILTNASLDPDDSALGTSVAISDGRLIAGAWIGNITPLPRGAVHVFDLNGATPTVPVMILTNPGPVNSFGFGKSVAASGARIAVGTPGDNTGAQNSGCAYIYDLASATPTLPVATLTNPTPTINGYFGFSVAFSENRVVVGTLSSVHVYVYDLTSVTPGGPTLTLTNRTSGLYFGNSVAISGDRVVVGSRGFVGGSIVIAGNAQVFDLSSATPTLPIVTLTDPAPTDFVNYGSRLALDDNIVVVAPGVYVFGPKPKLNLVNTAPGLASLSWTPTTSSGFALQFADSLPSTNWLDAPSGITNPVTISTTNTERFYRLSKP